MNEPLGEQEHRRVRADLGAYALGQLDAGEVAALEEHLAGCAACRAELAEVLPAAGALASLRAGRVQEADVRPPAELGDRVVATVARAAGADRRATRLRIVSRYAGVAIAAAAVVVLAVLALDRGAAPAPTVPLEAVPVQAETPGLRASADLVDHTWGVEVKLTATGFDRGDRYSVAVLGRDGTRHLAGGFVGTGAVEMHCNLSSDLLRDRATGFEVEDSSGRVVATSTF